MPTCGGVIEVRNGSGQVWWVIGELVHRDGGVIVAKMWWLNGTHRWWVVETRYGGVVGSRDGALVGE